MEYTDLKRKLILMEEDQKCSGFQLFHYEQMLEQEISPEDLIEAAEEIAENWDSLSSEKKQEFAEREEMLKQEAFKGKPKASTPKELANHNQQSIQKQLDEIKQSIKKISLAQTKQTPKAKVSEDEKEDNKEASNNGEEDCDQVEEPKKQEKESKQSNLKHQSSSKQGSKQKYKSGCKRRMN